MHPRMLCKKFWLKMAHSSGEEDLKNFVYVVMLSVYDLPLEMGMAIKLNKLDFYSLK